MTVLARSMVAICLLLLAGCSLSPRLYEIVARAPHVPDPTPLDSGKLPAPDTTLKIPQLGPCTDAADGTLQLSSGRPVTVLVHGCRGSSGHFRALAQLHAFHGQQAICFGYDAGDSLVNASAQLVRAVERLSRELARPQVTLIGHSMGGLVARRALEESAVGEWRGDPRLRLVTVSAPFSGIRAAAPCGHAALHWASLGLVPAICWAITGDNWYEITPASGFIRDPRPLHPAVGEFLKIVTDERESCRRRDGRGRCLESDHIFSLEEQYHPVIDRYPRLRNIEVRAGHVEIVGHRDLAPRKLIAILQENGVLAATPASRRQALERLLAELY